jgi:hypothetical protein
MTRITIYTTAILFIFMALQPANALYCASWHVCTAKLRYQAAWRAQHPGVNYWAALRGCFRTVDRSNTLAMQGCVDRVSALKTR